MRFVMAGLLVAASLPLVGAPPQKRQCKSACDAQYDLCLKRSLTKPARKNCTAARKNCKSGCNNAASAIR